VLAPKFRTKIGRVLRRIVPARWQASTPHPVLAAALDRWARASSDIHDHLGTLFHEAVAARPRLIVELGTRGGVSTRALLAAAEAADAHLLSVDIEDCAVELPPRLKARWTFVRADDLAFAGQPFEEFCAARKLPPAAEVIFVDTSHEYRHTKAEIERWMPRLAPTGVMMFHDTNMGRGWYRTLAGKAEPGGNSTRGVIQAVEEFLGRRYDERTFFADAVGGFAVSHVPWSSGFLVLRRIG
jgi:predicted O-methyltransferase YrrM